MLAMGPDKSPSDTIVRPLQERIRSAAFAAMAYWYYGWDWGESVAFDGINAAAIALHDSCLESYVIDAVSKWVAAPANTRGAARMGPTRCALRIYRKTRNAELLDLLKSVADEIVASKRHASGALLLDYPTQSIFVDSLYGDPTFLIEFGKEIQGETYVQSALDLCLHHTRHLQDEKTGLFKHFVNFESQESPRIFWGRGNGWATLGLAEAITSFPVEFTEVEELKNCFSHLCQALKHYQTPGGAWRNLIDEDSSYPEASVTAMAVAGITLAVRDGIVEESYQEVADRGWDNLKHRIDANGHVTGVSYRPGLNNDPARYEHTPAMGSYPWGQGPYLIAASNRCAFIPKAQ